MERAIMCPQCNAPLSPHKFARSIICAYCGSTVQLDGSLVLAENFRQAYRAWNSPSNYQITSWVSMGESHWAVGKCIANGDLSDVYTGQRARWPTELAIIKVLRDRDNLALFDNEWNVLQQLQQSDAPGADTFTMLLPQPIIHGDSTAGSFLGERVSIFRWASGFHHTFEEVIQTYPQGIPPRASIWIWRRILEVLAFIHNSGMVHGAVLPGNLLIQENEHGVRLVGYSVAGHSGKKLLMISQQHKTIYPEAVRSRPILTTQLDLTMSARCIIAILGGDPETGSLPKAVPSGLARLVKQVALTQPSSTGTSAWGLREELGVIANSEFGAPKFIPIIMPS
jgi:serine/threonine protein kinase